MDGKIMSIDGDGGKIDTNNNLDNVKSVYVKYLSGLHSPDNPWVMGQFEVGDGTLIRGLRATRDIRANELVFRDRALVIGPRCNNYEHIFCVVCYKTMSSLVMCPFGCRLPVCDNSCSDSDRHRPECELIRRWEYVDPLRKYSKVCFRSLPQIRGLLLPKDEKSVVAAMAANPTKQVSAEAEWISKEFKNVPRETVDELKLIIAALNTNAFETITTDQTSLRGLFPLAAAMNHNCVPNVRYTFDKNAIMHVYATKDIKMGYQIFNNYTKILWSTQNRRVHLAASKQFFCVCERCSDPTEFGTRISALRCTKKNCPTGQLLPINSTAVVQQSSWLCNECNTKYSHPTIARVLEICSSYLMSILVKESVLEILKFLRKKVPSMLVTSNHFVLELKLQIIVRMDADSDQSKYELEDYEDKAKFCEEILQILDQLGAGECYLKGFLYYGLFKAKERIFQIANGDGNSLNNETGLLTKCWTILGNTATCPADLDCLRTKYQAV